MPRSPTSAPGRASDLQQSPGEAAIEARAVAIGPIGGLPAGHKACADRFTALLFS
jgi:hypothetical protein